MDSVKHNLRQRCSFVGRTKEITHIRTLLLTERENKVLPIRVSIVEIVGAPGVGKSALACEIGYLFLDEPSFRSVVWTDPVSLSKVPSRRDRARSSAASRAGKPDFESTKKVADYDAARQMVLNLLEEEPYLLIIDGFDEFGADANQDKVLEHLENLSSASRALVTCRKGLPERLKGLATIALGALCQEDAEGLIREAHITAGITTPLTRPDVAKVYAFSAGHARVISEGLFSDFAGGPLSIIDVALEKFSIQDVHGPCPYYCEESIKALADRERYILAVTSAAGTPLSQEEIALKCGLLNQHEATRGLNLLVKERYLEQVEINNEARYYVFPFLRERFLEYLSDCIDHLAGFAAQNCWGYLTKSREDCLAIENHMGLVKNAFEWYYQQEDWQTLAQFGSILVSALMHLDSLCQAHQREVLHEICSKTLHASEKVRDNEAWVRCASTLGWICLHSGDLDTAQKWAQEIAEKAKRDRSVSEFEYTYHQLQILGRVALAQKDFSKAEEIFEALHEIAEEIGTSHLAYAMICLGELNLARGRYAEARTDFQDAKNMGDQMGERTIVAQALMGTGDCLAREGSQETALDLYQDALSQVVESRSPRLERELLLRIKPQEYTLAIQKNVIASFHDLMSNIERLGIADRALTDTQNQILSILESIGLPQRYLRRMALQAPATELLACGRCRRLIGLEDYVNNRVLICPSCMTHVHVQCLQENSDLCPKCKQSLGVSNAGV